jgi:hypothetical protein
MDGSRGDVKTGAIRKTPAVYQVIDLQYMWGISDGNREYERTVTEQFIEVIPVDLSALESALEKMDLVALRHTAHAMTTDVAIMGLLEKVRPFLDVLEYDIFDAQKFQEAVLSVKSICLEALPEASQFYASL